MAASGKNPRTELMLEPSLKSQKLRSMVSSPPGGFEGLPMNLCSNGLKPTGSMNGECSKSIGQVYVRSATLKCRFAIMYSWYFPKDMHHDGLSLDSHRHDWEQIVVWLSSQSLDARVTGVSFSSHKGWVKHAADKADFDNDHPKVKYFRVDKTRNHSLDKTSAKGGQQPLINWPQMSVAARDELNKPDLFGDASVKFRDDNHIGELVDSWQDGF